MLRFRLLVIFAAALALPDALGAASFTAPTAEELALKSVAGHPTAAAVVLYRRGDFKMLDISRGDQSSTLTVEARIKILTEQGKKDYGEVAVWHGSGVRLKEFSGRTVLPDGRILPLDEASLFERKSSKSRRIKTTTAAFPGVEVGAILDYRYQVKWDSFLFLDPWVFQQEIPVMLSEITYHLPADISARAWSRDPMNVGVQHETKKTMLGNDVRVWAKNLPPILNEPFSFPDLDLAARFLLVPAKYRNSEPLLDTWLDTCRLVDNFSYEEARKNGGAARRKAKDLTASAASPKDKAAALFRFVRDSIETVEFPGIWAEPKKGPDGVLAAQRGDYADKAFLLWTLLEGVKLEADYIWAASRTDGMMSADLPTLAWFDRPILRLRLGSEVIFLDPSEKSHAFGQLAADHEGTQALLFSPKKPEIITLPTTPFDANGRQATVQLALDGEGKLSGSGRLVLTGHHAGDMVDRARQGESREKVWKEWLEGRHKGFAISEIAIKEEVDERRVEVGFKLEQIAAEVLGDEASFKASQPLGPMTQTLALPPERRATPLMFDYGDRDLVELTLTWPAGFRLEGQPAAKRREGKTGAFVVETAVDAAARTLTYKRRFDVTAAQFLGREEYAELRQIFAEAEASDAQAIDLVRE